MKMFHTREREREMPVHSKSMLLFHVVFYINMQQFLWDLLYTDVIQWLVVYSKLNETATGELHKLVTLG